MLFNRRKSIIIGATFIAFLSTLILPATLLAHNKVVVIPLFSDEVITSKVIFVTATTYTGDLGGISGADDKCQSEAIAHDIEGRFQAWINDVQSKGINDRESFAKHDLPYRNVDGSLVSPSADLLLSGVGGRIIPLDNALAGFFVWTNTTATGERFDDIDHCLGFTSDSVFERARAGISNREVSNPEWTDSSFSRCNSLQRLYCVEQ